MKCFYRESTNTAAFAAHPDYEPVNGVIEVGAENTYQRFEKWDYTRQVCLVDAIRYEELEKGQAIEIRFDDFRFVRIKKMNR